MVILYENIITLYSDFQVLSIKLEIFRTDKFHTQSQYVIIVTFMLKMSIYFDYKTLKEAGSL